MALHSFPKIDQKEYLKKYLSGDKAKKKKKKDKKHKKAANDSAKVKIIDDDVDCLDNGLEIDEELLLTGEDAPQIVGEYIEDRPAGRDVPKWKSIVIKDESDDDENHLADNNEEQLWGRKTSEVRVKQEFPISKKHANTTPDNSPNRKKDRRPPKSPSSRLSKRDKSPANKRQNEDANYSSDPRRKIKIEPLSPTHVNNAQKVSNKDSFDASSPRRRKDSDQSPSRRKQNSSPSPPSNNSTRHRRNSDQSPPRKEKNITRKRNNRSPDDISSPRRRKNSSQSPPTSSRNIKRSPDISPARRRRNSDQSPDRKYKKSSVNKTKLSSPCRHRRDSRDQSPPRHSRNVDLIAHERYKKRNLEQYSSRKERYSSDVSPPPRNKRRSETPDNSPPRRSRKGCDQSPTRRRRSSDQSPPRRYKTAEKESRIKLEKQTPDLSPQRNRQSRWERQAAEKSPSPPPTHKPKPSKTLEGKKAGLQNAQALQNETKERRKREDLLFETMSSDISGRNAEVQVRATGRKGRRAREAADEDPEERRRKEEREEEKKQKYDRWGKGLKQIEDYKSRMLQQEYESSKPLARYANDEDLERHLKEQERPEDPMLEYMRQKRKEKEKQSGKLEIPRYEGPYPENRFNIRPGYRWDGVDRSNGYENKYFAVQNEKLARQDEAYKYSVEDM